MRNSKMTNGLQLNQSTVVAGLGTSSYTASSTGIYTVEVKSFLPYFAAGQPPQSVSVSPEVVNVTAAADVAGSKNSTWWKFYSASDAYGFYVWYNINGAGVDPAPAGLTGIQVAGATGATAATLATATIAAINASATASLYVVASAGASGHLILSNLQYGDASSAANGTASYGAAFSITTAGSFGTPPASGLTVKIYNNSALVLTLANPSPTQAILGGSVSMSITSGNAVDVVLASLSDADSALNAVKSIVNLYQGK
jgi:hypothetical protein